MNKAFLFSFLLSLYVGLFLVQSSHAKSSDGESKSTYENPLFGQTHLLPSPYTISGGKLVLGTTSALGITDFFQVSSDILRDFYKVFNVSGKLQILDFQEFAMALTLGWEHYNLNDIDSSNPDVAITSWQPGAVTAFSLAPQLALFAGGHMNLTSIDVNTDAVKTSGYVQGFILESDLSWAYNPKKRGLGNVLSTGATYDFTYKIYGIGISHHWPGFHFGIHYYPNASKYKVQPIIAGGAVIDL